MTNRATRGLELFEAFEQISFDEAWQLKHDNRYSDNYRGMAFLDEVTSLPKASDDVSQAIDILATWDRGTDKDNRGAALGVCVLAAEWQAESGGTDNPDAQEILDDCIDQTLEIGGRLDPRWGDVNRHGRDGKHWPVQGALTLFVRFIRDDLTVTTTSPRSLWMVCTISFDGRPTERKRHLERTNTATT